MKKIKTWLKSRAAADESPLAVNIRQTGTHAVSRPKQPTSAKPRRRFSDKQTDAVDTTDEKVLIRNKYVREDTGTHESLKILDDSLVDSGEETGIDPYNTGAFDRSKNWNNRSRK